MRFIIMHKTNAHWEAGAIPTPDLIGRVGGLLGQLAKAGALLAGEGLRPRDAPFIGLDLAGQQLEQSGLARAVRPDDSDPVATLDAQREVADDLPLAEALRDVLGVDHRFRPHVVLGERELGGARRAEHGRPLGAHFVNLLSRP